MNNMQKKHKLNDIIKNNLAQSLGYKLLRVWEDEINESNLIKRIYNI
jgi:very-short-patch-repair endonuclease